MTYTIDMTYDQVESIVVNELHTAIEMCLMNMADATCFEEDLTDYELLGHFLHVLQYFTTREDFQKMLQVWIERFESFDFKEIFGLEF